MTIGWGIIGTGNYPNISIAPAINQANDAGLIAVYSRDQGRGETFAKKHGAKTAYTSVEDLLNDSRVDAVYIASPNHLHAPHTEQAANAGKHVMAEKPLALDVAEGLEMVRTCRARRVKLGVGFQLRHHPGHMEASRLLKEGALGTVALAQAQLGSGVRGEVRSAPRTGLREWRDHPEMFGGALTMIGQGVHCVDDLHFILGQHVVEIAAITDSARARWLFMPCTVGKGNKPMWRAGIDDEEYVRVNGEWKFKSKTSTGVFNTPFEEGWANIRFA